MAKQCNYKKKGFRQMSMEADPYELDSMNTNMSKQSKTTAEAIYGDPQGAMMVGNVQLQQQDTSAYSRPAGAMQQSEALPFSIKSVVPELVNNTAISGGHNFSGSVGNVQNVQQDTSGYTATSPALGGTLTGDTANDVAFFSSTNNNTDEKEGNTGPLAGAFVQSKKKFTDKLMKAGGKVDPNNNNSGGFSFDDQSPNANQDKFNRIKKRMEKWEERTSDGKTGVGRVLSGIGGLFKKKGP